MVSLSPDGKSNPAPDTVTAVVVAAGRGERIGDPAKGPKQYRAIGGKPVIRHTLEALRAHPRIGGIVVAIHADDEDLLHRALSGLGDNIKIVIGGPTRQESTLRALEACEAQEGEIVLIHDAVRPFVDAATIDRVIEATADSGAAIPALPVSDTLKRAGADGHILENVPRDGLHAAQTPQGFRLRAILRAHRRAVEAGRTDFTDDAAIAQWAGLSVRVVAGTAQNVKLTWPEDLRVAEARLTTMESERFVPDVRTGNGYDVHSFEPGDHVTLCGVRIAHSHRLSGHSDADVGLHALTDALLATCGAGDIGTHFPPSDPQWKGAASRLFVEHAVAILREHGARIANADVTLICEAPRIGDHRPAMVAAMAEMLGIEAGRVSVKATTNEKLGFIGRREGIAAIATASVVYPGSL